MAVALGVLRTSRDPGRARRRTAALAATAVALTTLALGPVRPAEAAVQEERVRIGTSVRGRPIVAVHRWTPGATRTVLVIGSMHGDERAGMRVVKRLRERRLPPDLDLWLVRTMNPDGTRADRRTNARGVDLNRNFPRRWVLAGKGTAKYSGPRRASEPETRAVLRLVRDRTPRTTIVFHQPLYGVDSYRAKSMRLVRALSREAGLPVRSFDCRGGCHGTLTDWHNDRTPGRAVTVEFGRSPAAKKVGRVTRAVVRVG